MSVNELFHWTLWCYSWTGVPLEIFHIPQIENHWFKEQQSAIVRRRIKERFKEMKSYATFQSDKDI